jgi:curli biogenesis system outer membrane secretion channel CsgG
MPKLKNRAFICVIISCVMLSGCASVKKFFSPGKASAKSEDDYFSFYSGPKVRIFAPEFEILSTNIETGQAQALHRMFILALVNSNRFKLGASANIQDKDPQADIIINTRLTEFEPQSSGGREGLGGAGGAERQIFGGVLGASANKEHISLEIRIADAVTSEVLASKLIFAQASEGVVKKRVFFFAELSSSGALSAYANTPMERAIRSCLREAVRFIIASVPQKYYRD